MKGKLCFAGLVVALVVGVVCGWLFADEGSIPKPAHTIREAMQLSEAHFKKLVDADTLKSHPMLAINYTAVFLKNKLGQWCWVVRFRSTSNASHSYSLQLKRNGEIKLLGISE